MSCKKSNKIKLKTRKAASKRFTFKKRGEYRVIDILLPEDFKISGVDGDVKSTEEGAVSFCNDPISIVEKRSRISISRTIAGKRHSMRKRSGGSLQRKPTKVLFVGDKKNVKKYNLHLN